MRTDQTPAIRARYDTVIIGGGPAGSTAACAMAEESKSVLVVEKTGFPRFKVCGCCVNPRSLRVLERMGLRGSLDALGAIPLRRLIVASEGRRAELIHDFGLALSRAMLDDLLLHHAAQKGALVRTSCQASLVSHEPGTPWLVRLRGDDHRDELVHADCVVVATGLAEPLAGGEVAPGIARPIPSGRRPSHIGAGVSALARSSFYQPETIYMACGRQGYVGLVLVEGGRLNIAAALNPEAVRDHGGLASVAGQILIEAGLDIPDGLSALTWKGTPRLTRVSRTLARDRLFRVGDAAGYIEPFTGEGMAWALTGGRELGHLLGRAQVSQLDAAESAWRAIHHREVVARQSICWLVAGGLRSSVMTHIALRVLGWSPNLARPFLRMMHRVP